MKCQVNQVKPVPGQPCRTLVRKRSSAPGCYPSDRAWPGSWCQPEGRVPIRDQGERVGDDAVVPAENAFDEAEYAARVEAGEQDGEPGHDHYEERRDVQEEQHDVV